jgi:hypothetical protein
VVVPKTFGGTLKWYRPDADNPSAPEPSSREAAAAGFGRGAADVGDPVSVQLEQTRAATAAAQIGIGRTVSTSTNQVGANEGLSTASTGAIEPAPARGDAPGKEESRGLYGPPQPGD